MHWHAVPQDMKVRLLEVHNPVSPGHSDIPVSNVPFLGDGPVENRGSRWQLGDFEMNSFPDHRKGTANSVTGNAPANGIKGPSKSIQFLPNDCRILFVDSVQKTHRISKSGWFRS